MASVAPVLGINVFDSVTPTIPVNIPCGSQMSYYSRWPYFSNFIESEGFSFSAQSADSVMGTVTVLTAPTCQSPQAVVNATANAGFRFDHWSDGNTDNPRSLTLTSDTTIVAYFVANGTQGIDDVEGSDIKISVLDGHISVEGIADEEVRVYDIAGRMVPNRSLPFGVFMVKVGNLPAKKVAVVR